MLTQKRAILCLIALSFPMGFCAGIRANAWFIGLPEKVFSGSLCLVARGCFGKPAHFCAKSKPMAAALSVKKETIAWPNAAESASNLGSHKNPAKETVAGFI
ncbi:hypothetical protein [Eikenella sp. Marseille-P7795]|uniref:hypothetical protein n=1 Tax=Eikenella sp. Marseille-P7795 TaxID=2866577 RepID=UPI001CE3E961|nr:hypothetical protein [Eikenella sp. Marseille-P7795]